MAKLIYSAIASLDGYVADEQGNFQWAAPDEQVHAFVNDLERPLGTYLYGRRMYETMVYWETAPPGDSPIEDDYTAIWKAADKVVYSTTLAEVSSARTRIERAFEPDALQRMKDEATHDLSIGGPTLAASAIAASLVDEIHLFVVPVIVGEGLSAWPDVRVALELVDEHRFDNGTVYLKYATAR